MSKSHRIGCGWFHLSQRPPFETYNRAKQYWAARMRRRSGLGRRNVTELMLEQVGFQLSHNWSSLTIRQFSTGINPANKLRLVITKLTKVQDSENVNSQPPHWTMTLLIVDNQLLVSHEREYQSRVFQEPNVNLVLELPNMHCKSVKFNLEAY